MSTSVDKHHSTACGVEVVTDGIKGNEIYIHVFLAHSDIYSAHLDYLTIRLDRTYDTLPGQVSNTREGDTKIASPRIFVTPLQRHEIAVHCSGGRTRNNHHRPDLPG